MPADEDIWIEAERGLAEDYLREQGVEHLGVGEYPAFHVHPYFALWAVQSKRSPGAIGWWAVTGDLTADYISSHEGTHPREAMRAFARHWQEVSGFMLRGEQHPDYRIGTPDNGRSWEICSDAVLRLFRDMQTTMRFGQRTWPNHTLQRTRRQHHGCNPRLVGRVAELGSLGDWGAISDQQHSSS